MQKEIVLYYIKETVNKHKSRTYVQIGVAYCEGLCQYLR